MKNPMRVATPPAQRVAGDEAPVTVSSRDLLAMVSQAISDTSRSAPRYGSVMERHHPELWVTVPLPNGAAIDVCLVVSEVQPVTA